jgi:hypothetical protein
MKPKIKRYIVKFKAATVPIRTEIAEEIRCYYGSADVLDLRVYRSASLSLQMVFTSPVVLSGKWNVLPPKPFSPFISVNISSSIQMWISYSQLFMLFMFPILSRTVSCFPSFTFLCSFSSATRLRVFATLIPVGASENVCQVSWFRRRPQRWKAIWVAAGRLIMRHIALLRRIGWVQIHAMKNEVKEQRTIARLRGYTRLLLELWVFVTKHTC